MKHQKPLWSLFTLTLVTLLAAACNNSTRSSVFVPATDMATPVPPTATHTPIPPTATPTPAPATATLTPIPPTTTPTPVPAIPTLTPTVIPVDEPTPTAASTRIPSPTAEFSPDNVDLSTFDESLALLDHLERRAGPTPSPTPTPLPPTPTPTLTPTPTPTRENFPKAGKWQGGNPPAEMTVDADGNISFFRLDIVFSPDDRCTITDYPLIIDNDGTFTRIHTHQLAGDRENRLTGRFESATTIAGTLLLEYCIGDPDKLFTYDNPPWNWSAQWVGP